MRFNFDISETNKPERRSLTPPTPKEEVEWLPLQNHPVFTTTNGDNATPHQSIHETARNLMAWDRASRLYFWDSDKQCLHRISIRLGEPDSSSILAASPSKVLHADIDLDFAVNKISINRNGSAILLTGSDGLYIMYLYGRNSTKSDAIICRTVSVGSRIYFSSSNVIRALQVSWHPYSDTHLGILSSDSVFRLFDLSSDLGKPEQEYYLQPVESGRSRSAASICPVDFSFGGDHLWDRFSVFVLFSDGSVYVLCPVVPFGSVYRWESIVEIYTDAQTFGLKSTDSRAVSNSNLAITWLKATFPELARQAEEGGNLSALKARPNALFDASLALQGPLQKVCHGEEKGLAIRGAECEGRAVSFLYNSVSKDSILVTAWSGGQLQIDALVDEIQPVWIVNSPPRLLVDSHDHILGLAMICETIPGKLPIVKLDQPLEPTVWLGHPPPLLSLAIVDLALPKSTECGSFISMFPDPLIPEKIYSVHGGGIDSIVLHFLPFTSQASGKDETMRTPSVHTVLSTCPGETSSLSPLFGLTTLSDSFGYSWIVGVTFTRECVVLETKSWDLLLSTHIDMEKKAVSVDVNPLDIIISKELLIGPKANLLPQASASQRSIAADSIEGRSTLHQYFKLFHENYVEYAHKVYFELMHHGPQLKRIISDQHARLSSAQEKLLKVEEKQPCLEEKISNAIHRHHLLEERMQRLRNLPGAHKKPLSRAEREFKLELDRFRGVELDALHSSIEALSARARRYSQCSKGNVLNQQRQVAVRRNRVEDVQISHLRSSVEKLSLVNSENTNKVKFVESVLRSRENSLC